jgi:hypothetical protein
MKIRTCAALFLSLALAVSSFAQSTEKKETAAAAPAPDEKAMMEAWMKAMTPGDPHKKLESFVGSWDVKVKSWMAPGAPPMESAGKAENTWALGGRYVEQRFDGSFMGQPFAGIGYTGYDNIRKQYVSTWIDSMSTAVMMSTGSMSGNTFNFNATVDDPMTGKAQSMTEKVTVTDADHHTMEMWGPGPDGKSFKMMEIAYSRKK